MAYCQGKIIDAEVQSDVILGSLMKREKIIIDTDPGIALIRPDLFAFKKGVVRVETQGICAGHTWMEQGLKKYIRVTNGPAILLFPSPGPWKQRKSLATSKNY